MKFEQGKDRFKKNLRVGVKSDGASMVFLDGTAVLPALTKGFVGELILSPESFIDKELSNRLSRERIVPLLDQGTYVMVGVGTNMLGDFQDGLIPASELRIPSAYMFVPVKLNTPAFLCVRGDQEARLSDCSCTVLSIDKSAISLNHAFTLISEAYETKRRSHSGNVFDRVYAEVDPGHWRSLDDHRLRAIAGPEPERAAG
jgi:hypothetical protein